MEKKYPGETWIQEELRCRRSLLMWIAL